MTYTLTVHWFEHRPQHHRGLTKLEASEIADIFERRSGVAKTKIRLEAANEQAG